MNKSHEVSVVESWKITVYGVIVELKHYENGLPRGTILWSKSTDLKWTVDSRVLFSHAFDKQIKFKNEKTLWTRGSFIDIFRLDDLILEITEREKNNIFQYRLIPIGHDANPIKNETLVVENCGQPNL